MFRVYSVNLSWSLPETTVESDIMDWLLGPIVFLDRDGTTFNWCHGTLQRLDDASLCVIQLSYVPDVETSF